MPGKEKSKNSVCKSGDYYDYCIFENTKHIRYFSFILIFAFSSYLLLSIFISESLPNINLQFGYHLIYALLIAIPAIFAGISFLILPSRLRRMINFLAIMLYGMLLVILSTLDNINTNEISAFTIMMIIVAIIYHENLIVTISILSILCFNMIINLLIFSSESISAVKVFDVIIYYLIALALSIIMGKSHFKLFCTSKILELKSIKLEEMSFKDSLTGLYNRRYLFSILDNESKRYKRHKTPFSIILFDLDHFKEINDNYGHVTGDKVLSKIGDLLNKQFRSEDVAARYGGEEFLIILVETTLDTAYKVANRLRATIENYNFPSVPHSVTASFSVAEFSKENEIEEFIARADKKLYKAKHKGRNRVMK